MILHVQVHMNVSTWPHPTPPQPHMKKTLNFTKSSGAIFGGVRKKHGFDEEALRLVSAQIPKFDVSGPSSLGGFAVDAPSPLPSSSLLLSAPAMSIWRC